MKTFGKIVFGSALGYILASLFGLFIFIFSIVSIAGSSSGKSAPLPSGESILVIDFSRPVTEQAEETFNLAAGSSGSVSTSLGGSISLYSMVKAIETAATDPQIKFIYMKPDDPALTMSIATAEEVRRALAEFRSAGKAVISYSNQLTGEGYYLASVADRVMFNAYGDPMIFGMSTGVVFFKDALDKLGVEMQLIRHGKYKAAGEQFTKNGMTPENQEQNQAMIDAMWKGWAEDISASRGFSADEFNGWLDNLELNSPQALLDKGLVDELCYQSDVDEYLCSLCDVDDADNLKMTDIAGYAAAKVKSSPVGAKEKIAVVYADGEILVDSPNDRNISGIQFADILADIRKDSTVKAVVLRVNSPGGAAQGAEMINHELGLLKERKPVIASFGDYAASGGYWIAARADRIFCDRSTLTGSIGVFSLIPSFGNALNRKVGVNIVSVNSNRHSDMLSMMRPLDNDEAAYMEQSIEKVYGDFTALVAEGRKMPVEKVDELGQGRVWTGIDAVNAGLADETGGLADAIRYAENIAGLTGSSFRIVEYPEVKTAYERIIESLSGTYSAVKSTAEAASSPVSAFEAAYSSLREETSARIYARIPYVFEFR